MGLNMLKKIEDGLKYLLVGFICLIITILLWSSITNSSEYIENVTNLPNYNYIPDVKKLKEEGKLQEALELTRFILKHPDMPGQEEAKILEQELETEINSLWGKIKRSISGFVWGSGNSIEEIIGGITSDMIVWGDVRDLLKQGYYKITGNETDMVIVALASVGLLTEVVDVADWAPAVLKAFRKVGALSKKFADFIITTAKNSVKVGKLDNGLKVVFKSVAGLVDNLGLARSATVMKHVDTVDDLTSVAKIAEKNTDTAYLMIRNGGSDGITLIKQLGNSEDGIKMMNDAVKKGPGGIAWLKRGGAGRKYVLTTRFGARILKNLRLERPQHLIKEIIKTHPNLKLFFWVITLLFFAISILSFYKAVWNFYYLFIGSKSKTLSKDTAN